MTEDKHNFCFPKQYPCTICGQMTNRVDVKVGSGWAYQCSNKKCHRHKNYLYGAVRNELDIGEEKWNEIDTTTGKTIHSIVTKDNKIKITWQKK